jgi:hypothetical protein
MVEFARGLHDRAQDLLVLAIAGFGWQARLDSIRDPLVTNSFEDGAAWFKEHRK